MGLADQIILRGTRAAQPAAASLTPGALYCVTDEGRIIERTTGAAWESYSSAAGAGDVTASGTLTASRLIVGGGTTVVSALASLGTTTTLLHGNAAGAPTFATVVEADITLADNTTNNAATTKHGLLKKLSNVATEYMDGTGAWSTPGGGGGLVLVQQQTASASATLDFAACITSTYDEYVIECLNIIPATNGAFPWLRMSTDGGATYDAGANYQYDQFVWRAAGSVTRGGTGQTKIVMFEDGDGLSNTSTYGLCGSMTLFSPLSTAVHKFVTGKLRSFGSGTGTYLCTELGGAYVSTTAVNAFQMLFSTGNITSGIIRVYGVAK